MPRIDVSDRPPPSSRSPRLCAFNLFALNPSTFNPPHGVRISTICPPRILTLSVGSLSPILLPEKTVQTRIFGGVVHEGFENAAVWGRRGGDSLGRLVCILQGRWSGVRLPDPARDAWEHLRNRQRHRKRQPRGDGGRRHPGLRYAQGDLRRLQQPGHQGPAGCHAGYRYAAVEGRRGEGLLGPRPGPRDERQGVRCGRGPDLQAQQGALVAEPDRTERTGRRGDQALTGPRLVGRAQRSGRAG